MQAWIDAKKETPKNCDRVWVMCSFDRKFPNDRTIIVDFATAQYFEESGKWSVKVWCSYYHDVTVTHWMEMCKPPDGYNYLA